MELGNQPPSTFSPHSFPELSDQSKSRILRSTKESWVSTRMSESVPSSTVSGRTSLLRSTSTCSEEWRVWEEKTSSRPSTTFWRPCNSQIFWRRRPRDWVEGTRESCVLRTLWLVALISSFSMSLRRGLTRLPGGSCGTLFSRDRDWETVVWFWRHTRWSRLRLCVRRSGFW